jgi:hypothetical protein
LKFDSEARTAVSGAYFSMYTPRLSAFTLALLYLVKDNQSLPRAYLLPEQGFQRADDMFGRNVVREIGAEIPVRVEVQVYNIFVLFFAEFFRI